MLELTETERNQIREARKIGAIADVDEHRLKQTMSTIGVVCPDCDKCPEIEEFHQRMTGTKRHHFFKLNGGALLLSLHSPLNGASSRGLVLLEDTVEAVGLKRILTFVLVAHIPCGKVRSSSLEIDFWETLRLTLEAKQRAQHFFQIHKLPKINIACFIQDSDRQKTYFIPDSAREVLEEVGRGPRPQF